MEKRRNFTGYASVTLADGNSLTLTENEFTLDNNSVTESAGFSGLPLGEAICRTAQIEIINPHDKYSDYDFVGAKINLELRFWLDGETESFDIGKFTVVDPATYGETIIITALDDMRKADKNYNTDLAFPATAKNVLADICNRCEITLATTSFTNDSFVIQNRPSGNYHFRTVIGYIAMIAGGNARINRSGELEIMSYDFTALEDLAVRGGTFSPWTSGDTLSGGTLNPWTTGDTTSGGDFVGKANYHLLKNFKNLKVDTDEIEITGVSMTVENDMGVQDLISGTEGYVLNIDNPLLAGKEEEGLALIASVLVGGKMRKFEGDHIAYPLAEFMDPCLVIDRKGNMYPSILTDIDFEFFGFTKFKNTAASKESLKSKASSKYQHELIKVEKKAEDLVEAEKTAREEAINNLNSSLADSSGMYTSDVKQSDGSTIRYLHDKPSLAESKNVIKITSEAIGISNDGGATYPYGFTLNGETITKYLYAEGIDADYITVGRISDANENNYWDLEKGEVVINKATINADLNADKIVTGKIQDSTGANYWDLDAGKMVINDATINAELNADKITTGALTVKDANGNIIFETNIDDKKVTIGGFTVTKNSIYKGVPSIDSDDTVGIYIGNDGIRLNNGENSWAQKMTYSECTYYGRDEGSGENPPTASMGANSVFNSTTSEHPLEGDITNFAYISFSLDGEKKGRIDHEGIKKYNGNTASLILPWDGLADFVVERGTSGIWTYEKWNSGKAVVYGNYSATNINAAAKQMNGYYYSDIIEVAFPFSFVGNSTPTVFIGNGPTNCVCLLREFTSNNQKARFIVVGHDSSLTSLNFTARIIAYGKWK